MVSTLALQQPLWKLEFAVLTKCGCERWYGSKELIFFLCFTIYFLYVYPIVYSCFNSINVNEIIC